MLTRWVSETAFLSAVAIPLAILLIFAVTELVLPRVQPVKIVRVVSRVFEMYLRVKHPIKSTDGLKEIPSCPYVWPDGQGDAEKFLNGIERSIQWKRRYGGLYRIWSGSNPEIVLTRPDQLKMIFHDSDRHCKAVNNDSGYLMSQLLGSCVGLISPPRWQRVREVTEKPFRRNRLSLRVRDIQEQVFRYCEQLWYSSQMHRGTIHPKHDFKLLPFRVVQDLIYGNLPIELVSQLDSLVELREVLMGHVVRGGLSRFNFSKFLSLKAIKDLKVFKQQWKSFNEQVFEHCCKDTVTSAFTDMYHATLTKDISQDELLQTLDEILFANLDVTIGGLSWNLVFLAANQDCQSKLRAEVMQVEDTEAQEKYLQSSETYLHACVQESSRLRPLAAFSVPQSAPTDRLIDGFLIPAHTNFVIDTHSVNVDNLLWGPDNDNFRPERFIDATNTELRYSFWRFGFGPRQCMGKYTAELIIRSTLCYIVQHYNLEVPNSRSEWTRDKSCWIDHPDFFLDCYQR